MKNNEIKTILLREAEEFVPDVKEKVLGKVYFNQYKAAAKKRHSRFFLAFAPVAAVLILAITLTAVFLPQHGGGKIPPIITLTESVVRLDINPSVKFNVSTAGLVTKQTPCNKDGAVLLWKQDFVNKPIESAAVAVVQLAVRCGYLTDTATRTVSLKVLNDNSETEVKLKEHLLGKVSAEMQLLTPSVKIKTAGKNEMVEFLVANKNYSRKDAERLTAEEIEDIWENLMEETPGNELDEFGEQIAKGMVAFLKTRHNDGKEIIKMMGKVATAGLESDDKVAIEEDIKNEFLTFVEKYSVDIDREDLDELTKQEFDELMEELNEEQREMEESLRELKQDKNEMSDILEDWYDNYKAYVGRAQAS